MTLHPLATSFAEVADAYERGRPEYPLAVPGAIGAELRVPAAGPVLDLAAGTGKLTRALHRAGYDVVAVEPQAPLRALLCAAIGANRVREGVAEAIPLPDASMAAVTVADAFHWFDQAVALDEIHRVLRPGGGLAIIDTEPGWAQASWAQEVGTLLSELRPEHPHFDGPAWQEAVQAAQGWGEPWFIEVTFTVPASGDRVLDHLASMSWIAALDPAERDRRLAAIGQMIAAGTTPETFPVRARIGLTTLA